MKLSKKVIRDIKRTLQTEKLSADAREALLALIIKTKGRMGWI